MRGKITAQGYTAEVESQPDGSFVLSLANSAGHVIAAAQMAADRPMGDAWPLRTAGRGNDSWAEREAS
jgi:hypothetical protein